MRKFKVGDKVRLINNIKKLKEDSLFVPDILEVKNKICEIVGITHEGNYYLDKSDYIFSDNMLEKANYTYEDLKKSPIGTKITFKNGIVLVKDTKEYFENVYNTRHITNLEYLEDIDFDKIIKIEEPEYQTVYESKPEILDEVEKRYLRGVIRPFRDRVKTISKFVYSEGNASIDISIDDNNIGWLIELPSFPKNEMYQGMEDNKKYTIEELGL